MSELNTEAAPAVSEAPAVVESAPAPTQVTIVPAEKLSIEDTMAQVYEKNNPDTRVDRAKTGEFKSKDQPAEGAEPSDTAPEITQEPAPKVEPVKAIDPPASWSTEDKAIWDNVPPAARAVIARRDIESHKRISELGQTAKSIEPIQQFLEPLNRVAQRHNVHPGEVLKNLLAAEDYLGRDSVGAIQWLAKQHGVDLSKFGSTNEGEPKDAHVAQLEQQVSALNRQLAGLTSNLTAREQRETEATQASLSELVEEFAKGKDYWPEIESEVVAQIKAIRTLEPNLDHKSALAKAHDRAVKLNEEVSNRLTKAKRDEEAAKKAAEDKRKADEAKKHASLNVKSNHGVAPQAGKMNMADEMAEVYDRMQRAS